MSGAADDRLVQPGGRRAAPASTCPVPPPAAPPGTLDDARVAAAVAAAGELAVLAGRLDTTAAALALAFPLTNPIVTSVLFGATSAEQVRANCAAIGLLDRLGPDDLAELQRIGLPEEPH